MTLLIAAACELWRRANLAEVTPAATWPGGSAGGLGAALVGGCACSALGAVR